MQMKARLVDSLPDIFALWNRGELNKAAAFGTELLLSNSALVVISQEAHGGPHRVKALQATKLRNFSKL